MSEHEPQRELPPPANGRDPNELENQGAVSETTTSHTEVTSQRPAPAERRKRSKQKVLAWIGAAALAVAIGSGIAVLRQTGGSPSRLASLYGLTVADFKAQARRESRPAPALVGEDLDGKRLALANYRGKIVILNIWGSWCGPCRREETSLVRVSKQYADQGVQFIGIAVRDQLAAAKAFREEFGVTYPSFWDPSAALAYQLGVEAVPTTFIIDRNQRIFFRFTGAIDAQLLQNGLTAALEESR